MTLKEQLKAKLDAQAALVKGALDANRAMTEEEQKKYNDLEKEIKNLEATIKAKEETEKRIADEQKPVTPPIPAEPKNKDEKKWKRGFGEYLQAVAEAGRRGVIDNRLIMNSATGMGVNVGADGGFMLEAEFVKELLDAMGAEAQVANRIRKIEIGENSDGLKILGIDESSRATGSRWGGVIGYWVAEAETVTMSKPKFRKIEIHLEKLMALCYATDELLRDATALESVVRQAYADEMSYLLDDAIINGSGVGKPLGILNSGALVTVAKETGQAADTVVYENVLKMWNRMPARLRKNAVWYINQEIEPQLYTMSLTIGTGGAPVYVPSALAAGGQQYNTLFGRPVIPIEQCQKLGDKGDIILMDPTQYIGIDKENVRSDVSIHVKFLYDESVFRFIYRFNGAPYRNTTITPANANSGYTLSPFITLAARA